MKRITFYVLLLIVITTLISCEQVGDAESNFAVQPLFGGRTVEIIDHIGNVPNVHIPDKIQKKQVVSIAPRAFARKGISSIIIPRSVKRIGENAFEGNDLRSITIGAKVDISQAGWNGNFYDFYTGIYGSKAGLYVYEPLKTKEDFLKTYFTATARWSSFSERNLRRMYDEHDMTRQEFFEMMHMNTPLTRENYKWIESNAEWEDFRAKQSFERDRINNMTEAEWAHEKKELRDQIDKGWENYQKNPEYLWHYLR